MWKMSNVTFRNDQIQSSQRSEHSERSLLPGQGEAILHISRPEGSFPAVPAMAESLARGEDGRRAGQTTVTDASPASNDDIVPEIHSRPLGVGTDDEWSDLEQEPSAEYKTSEYEGYILARAPAPRELPDWSRVSKVRLPVSSFEISEMNRKFRAEDGTSVADLFMRLNDSQQAIINRLITERQDANRDLKVEWNLEYIYHLTKSTRAVATLPRNIAACTKIVVLLRRELYSPAPESSETAKSDEIIDLAVPSQEKKPPGKTRRNKAKVKNVTWEEPTESAAGETLMPAAPAGQDSNTGAPPRPYNTAYEGHQSYPGPSFPHGQPYAPSLFMPYGQPTGPWPYGSHSYPPFEHEANVSRAQDIRQNPLFEQQPVGTSAPSLYGNAAGVTNMETPRRPQTKDAENFEDETRPHRPGLQNSQSVWERASATQTRKDDDAQNAKTFDAPVPSYNDAYRSSDRTPLQFSTEREGLGANSSTDLPGVSGSRRHGSNWPRGELRGDRDWPKRQEGDSSHRESFRSDHTKQSSGTYGSSQSRVLSDNIWSSEDRGDSTDGTSPSVDDETWEKAAQYRDSLKASPLNHRGTSAHYVRPRQSRETDDVGWMKDFTRMPSEFAQQPVARPSNDSRRRFSEPYWIGDSGEDGYQSNRYPMRTRNSSVSWDRRWDPTREAGIHHRYAPDDYPHPPVRPQKVPPQYESGRNVPGDDFTQRQHLSNFTHDINGRKVFKASQELPQALQESISGLLVSRICQHLREQGSSAWLWQSRAQEQLDCILSCFAILFAKRLSLPSMHARVISFIRTRSCKLANRLKIAVISRDSTAPQPSPGPTDTRLPTVLEQDDPGEPSQSGSTWKTFLVNSTEFRWLLDHMRRLSLFFPTDFAYFHVRTTIAESFEALPRGTDFKISLHWDPVAFLEHQFEQEDRDLSRAVTFCGSAKAAYATSVREYLDALWPNCGYEVLRCVKEACESADRQSKGHASGLHLEVHLIASMAFFALSGDPASVLEAAEASVWLATACREHEGTTSVAYCSALLTDGAPYLKMTPRFGQAAALGDDSSGLCWMKMVSNPVIAQGYPVPIREHPDKQEGLEICVQLMTALSQASWATSYNGFSLLKGVVSALVPRYQVGTSVVWHFFLEQTKSRLSFNDALPGYDHAHAIDVDMDSLCECRHFIGIWTSDAQIMAGRRDRQGGTVYDIDLSDCKAAKEYTCSLSNVSIAAGKFINLGMAFVIGKKDRAPALSWNAGEPYELQVQNVSELNIVLYGSELRDRRAWMIDGASAVLHLARAFMTSEGAQYISKGALNSLIYPTTPGGKKAATDALIENKRKRIVLFENIEDKFETTGTHKGAPSVHVDRLNTTGAGTRYEHKTSASTWTYADLVISLCQVLEAMHDKLNQLSYHPPELSLQSRWGKTLLSGWDFKDLLTRRGPYKPRVAELNSNAENWVKFVSRQNYVVLLASTFGEIIRPMLEYGSCLRAHTVPTGEDLLTVPLPILSSLSERWKDQSLSQGYLQIADDTFWHGFAFSISECSCSSGSNCTCAIISNFSRTVSRAKNAIDGSIALAMLGSNPLHAAIIGGGSNKLRKPLFRNARKSFGSSSKSQQACGLTHDSGYATWPPTPGDTSSFPTPNSVHRVNSLEIFNEAENGFNMIPGRGNHRTPMLKEEYSVRAKFPDTPKELKVPTDGFPTFPPSPVPTLTKDGELAPSLYETVSPDRPHLPTSQASLVTLAKRCPIFHPVLRELQHDLSTDSGDVGDHSPADKGDSRIKIGRTLRKVSGSRDLAGVNSG